MTTGQDLRLLPAASSVWLVCWALPVLPSGLRVALAAALVAVLGVVLVRVAQRRRAGPALVAVVCALTAVTAAGLRLAVISGGPVAPLAADGRVATVHGVIVAEPRTSPSRSWAGGSRTTLLVRVEQLIHPPPAVRTRVPVLVLTDGPAEFALGERVEVSGTLRPARPGQPLAAVLLARDPPQVLAEPGPALRASQAPRSGLRQAASGLSPDARGLLPALVVGDTSGLPDDLVADLRASGLAHLTAVSGANVAIVLAAVVLLARWCGVRGFWLPALGLLAIAGFTAVARPDPSVLRASVMGSLGVAAVLVSGRRPALTALLGAVVILLLVDPWLARSWGFALSVAATGGLLTVGPRLRDRLSRRLPRPLAEAVAVSFAAQLATLPLVVALSGRLSLVGVLANVVAAPAVPPATVLGAAAALASLASTRLAALLAHLAGWPVGWIATVARRSAAAPLAAVDWPDGPVGAVAVVSASGVVLLLVVAASRGLRWLPHAVRPALLVALVLLVTGVGLGPARWPPPGWVVVACDVGQGDGLVVAAGPGRAVVVDVGPDPVPIDRCLTRLGVQEVPLLVLSHAHADHVGGLSGVLEDRTVGEILVGPLPEPAAQAQQVVTTARTFRVPLREAVVGERGSVGPVRYRVLWPARVIRGEGSAPNNASLVLLMEVAGLRLLLTGDIEPPAQRALVAEGPLGVVDVVKVPHHGSRYQLPEFWSAVQARLAVTSVGEGNPYGHPDPNLLSRLEAAGTVVRRTDHSGDIAVVGDGADLRVVDRPG